MWFVCGTLTVATCTEDGITPTTSTTLTTTAEPEDTGEATTGSTPTTSGEPDDTSGEPGTGTTATDASTGSTGQPPPGCGDGVLDPGETCDDGPDNGAMAACTDLCAKNVCGDGGVGPGEYCDDGNQIGRDGCSAECLLESCGDGVVQPGELCDDGDGGDDGCTQYCQPPKCGDGLVQESLGEACDDYPSTDVNDECTDACQAPACGDGVLQVDYAEVCDDGNVLDDDACLANCYPATCGDGHVNVGVEQCDDANKVDDDACTNACTLAGCGDGIVQASEVCDDGNAAADDGCDPGCEPSVVQLAAGSSYTCARFRSGKVRCWGANFSGQLGLGDTVPRGDDLADLPTPFVPLGGKAVQLTTTGGSACALLDTGKVRCWGENSSGQLGYGNTEAIGDEPGEMPPPDVDLGGQVVALRGGLSHMCALMGTGKVRCWGYNFYGQLGLGHTSNIGDGPGEMPPPDLDLGGPVVDLGVGSTSSHNCVTQAGGALRCWGQNVRGQLGLGHKLAVGDQPGEMPPPLVNVGGEVLDYAGGYTSSCALLAGNKVRCWGSNDKGELMIGSKVDIGDGPGEMPPADAAFKYDAQILELQGGQGYMCFLGHNETGVVACWGNTSVNQLGYDSFNGNIGDVPGESIQAAMGFTTQMAVGTAHACAIRDIKDENNEKPGRVRCWGSNDFGALGAGKKGGLPPVVPLEAKVF